MKAAAVLSWIGIPANARQGSFIMNTILWIIIIFGLGAYFLPSILARKDENFWNIFLLNLLGGWTVALWIVALGWSLFFSSPRGKHRELVILDIIKRKGGRITPVEIAAETKLSIEDAKNELETLCDKGAAELQVTGDGNLVYVFRGFVPEYEKLSSKPPTDL